MPISEKDLGSRLEQALARCIGEDRYNLWFRTRTKLQWEGDELVVGTANRMCQEFLQAKYSSELAAVVHDLTGAKSPIRFVIDPELFRAARQAELGGESTTSNDRPPAATHVDTESSGSKSSNQSAAPKRAKNRKRRWRNLHQFVVGPCNRVAHASALAVAANPGIDVNPLVLHGPVGTGKTHLLEGIYLELNKYYRDWRIRFATSEDFTNHFVQAMRLGKLAAFRRQFRDCDALLIDDLHFLCGKRATQEEFLHTLDTLQADGRQLAITCDCHPRLVEKFLPELVDRLVGGAVWGIMPPDFDTRLNLLRAGSIRSDRMGLPHEVAEFLAEQLHGNVRELEGALNSLFHFSRVAGKAIDVPMAREVLGDLLRHSIRVIQLSEIDESVRGLLRLQAGALQGKERSWLYSHPRMIAMFLGRKHTSATHADIGRYFGNRNHSTVVAAEKKVQQWLLEDHRLKLGQQLMRVRDVVERIERELLA